MMTLPIRLRLTAWYFAVLAVVLSAFGVSAYLEMRHSIRRTVDEELQIRAEGVRQLIERDIQRGHKDDLPEGLREHTELRAGRRAVAGFGRPGQLDLSVPGHERLRSSPARDHPQESRRLFMGRMSRCAFGPKKSASGGESYLIQSAFEMDDFYEALDHFALLLFISIPSLLLCAAAGGYWISTRALAPVDQITQTAQNDQRAESCRAGWSCPIPAMSCSGFRRRSTACSSVWKPRSRKSRNSRRTLRMNCARRWP